MNCRLRTLTHSQHRAANGKSGPALGQMTALSIRGSVLGTPSVRVGSGLSRSETGLSLRDLKWYPLNLRDLKWYPPQYKIELFALQPTDGWNVRETSLSAIYS